MHQTTNFYDKVAKKFGGYAFGSHVEHLSEYPSGDPEKIFKEKLLGLATKNRIALDVGCGDGKFAFQIAKYFLSITGIDISKELLKIAKQKQNKLHVKNIIFQFQEASKTSFSDKSFDLIFSRRGPTHFSEFHRLLKSGGYFVGINIGEKDCQAIKEVFGRGQGYREWDTSRLEKDKQELKDVGFEIIFAQDYFYDEYYASYEDLDLFLQGVPIFEDFDSEKDRKFLEKYVAKFKTEKGIRFPRHRVVIVAKKSSNVSKLKTLITATEVINLYTQLNNLGIKIWIDGGWGVDALLGEQTRPHEDMDIVIQHKDVPKLRQLLELQGYKDIERDDTSAWNFVLGDNKGRVVDVHAITFDNEGNGLYGPTKKGVMYPASSLTGVGVVSGQKVRCISAKYLVKFHTGYKLDESDFKDVSALCTRFSLEYPEGYNRLRK